MRNKVITSEKISLHTKEWNSLTIDNTFHLTKVSVTNNLKLAETIYKTKNKATKAHKTCTSLYFSYTKSISHTTAARSYGNFHKQVTGTTNSDLFEQDPDEIMSTWSCFGFKNKKKESFFFWVSQTCRFLWE